MAPNSVRPGDESMKWPVAVQPNECPACLVSYAMGAIDKPSVGFSLLEACRDRAELVILDSGAFTVRRRGAKVNLDRYGAFAAEAARRGLVDVVVNLDVGNHADMQNNFYSLRRRVGDDAYTLWVHQPFMGWDSLKKAAERYPYIGLGTYGMEAGLFAVARTNTQLQFYKAADRILRDAGAAAHAFATTAASFLYDPDIEWLTVDSSSWVGSDRFGFAFILDLDECETLNVPHPYLARNRKTDLNNNIPTTRFDRVHTVLKRYGLSVAEWSALSKRDACVASGVGYMAMSDELARIRGARPTTDRSRLVAAGLPQLAKTDGTTIALVIINEMGADRFHGVVDVRERSMEAQ